jgi:hypothetical protein
MAIDGEAPYGAAVIIIKENCCEDQNGEPHEFLDEEDSSLTR